MALLRSKLVSKNIAKQFLVASRHYTNKIENDPEELATGIRKFELEQIRAGNTDPFKLKAMKRNASTKNDPNLVPSYYDCRIVGCICEEESNSIVWMWLFKGEPKRCKCGHWFKLIEYRPI